MWKFITIFSCLGLSWGMQPGLEYQYRYNGRLATGITEMRHQFAGVGIQADLTLQMAEDYTFLIQFSNVEVGDFHDDLNCDLRSPLPITYEFLQEGREILQKPFRVFMNSSKELSYLEVPEIEPTWITNIRKSVVDVFPLASLWREIEGEGSRFARPNFGVDEELIGGHCRNWYLVTRMPEDEAARVRPRMESGMEEDVQHQGQMAASLTSSKGRGASGSSKGRGRKGSKTHQQTPSRLTNIPSLHENLWTVTRTVDYDADYNLCGPLVAVKSNGNRESDHLISRTSVAQYILRGDEHGIRIEEALVEGAISVFIGTNQKDRIDTFTNQTLELRAVRRISNEIRVDSETRRIHSWSYEMDTPPKQGNVPDDYRNIEQILSGTQLTEDDINDIMPLVFSCLRQLSSAPNNLVVEMGCVVEAITYLSYQRIEEVYERLQGEVTQADVEGSEERIQSARQDIHNFKIALTVAGTDPAVNFLLLSIFNDKVTRLEDETISFFFKTIPTTLKNPSLIQKILDLSMSMSWSTQEELAKTLALTGGASLANKFCLNPERRNTFKESTRCSERACVPNAFIGSFIPYLEEGLQNKSAPSWHRVIYVQALSNLGTPQTIEILHPLILGLDESHVGLRTTAISSLSSNLMHHSARHLVHSLLMPIIENKGENPQVRSMAFLVMVSWQPGLGWWKQMALSTWHDSSSQVANFISSSINSIANSDNKIAEMVSRVVYLTKPAAPISLTHSTNIYLRDYINSEYLDKESSIIWFANSEGLLPNHIFVHLQLQRLHGFHSTSKTGFYQNKMDFFITILKMYIDQFRYGDQSSFTDDKRLIFELASKVVEDLHIGVAGFPIEAELFLQSNGNFGFAHKLEFYGRRGPFGFIREVQRYLPRTLNNIYYDKTVDNTIAYPTDLGLPFVVQYSVESALKITPSGENVSWLTDTPDARSTISNKFSLQWSQETSINTKTLVPWLKSGVGSGVRTHSNLILPLIAHLYYSFKSTEVILRMQLSQNKVQPITASNRPYTVRYRGTTTLRSKDENEFKQCIRYDNPPYSWKARVAPWSGMWFESSWNGDCESPTFSSLLRGEFNALTPTLDSWEYLLNYDEEVSDTKAITTIFIYATAEKTSSQTEGTAELDSLGQESQSHNVDYSDYSQFSQSSSSQDYSQSSFQGGEECSSVDQRISEGDNVVLKRHLLGHINQWHDQVLVGHVTSWGFMVHLEGTTSYDYEAILMKVKETTNVKSNIKYKLKLHGLVPQGVLAEPHMTCIDISFEEPNFLPLIGTEDLLAQDFSSTVKSEINKGVSCNDSPILEMQANVQVTEAQKNNIRKKLLKGCDYNNEMPSLDIITSQVYDHAHLEIKWTDDFPESWMNSTYQICDMIRESLYTKVAFDHTAKNPSNVINFDSSKNIKTNTWEVRRSSPSIDAVYAVKVPSFMSIPASFQEVFVHQFINGRNPSTCIINEEKVHTFDGVEFPFSSNNCWKLVSIEKESSKFIFQVRYTEEWEARILWQDKGFMFDITSSDIKVNGEPDTKTSDKYEVFHLEDAILLILGNGMAVKVSDKVEIHSSFDLRAKLFGICGNFDGEKTFDLIGPSGCVFSDPELFADAWESSGDGCSAFAYRGRRRKVEAYQSNCLNKTYVPTGISHPNTRKQCTGWEHQARMDGQYLCEAIVPTPLCYPGCVSTHTSEESILFDCYLDERNGEEHAKKCYPKTFTATFPDDCTESVPEVIPAVVPE